MYGIETKSPSVEGPGGGERAAWSRQEPTGDLVVRRNPWPSNSSVAQAVPHQQCHCTNRWTLAKQSDRRINRINKYQNHAKLIDADG